MEKESLKDRLDIEEQDCELESKFRLFKLVKRHTRTRATYYSAYTGIHYEIDEEKIPMIKATCNKGLNRYYWDNLLKNHIGGINQFILVQNVATKCLFRHKNDEAQAQIEDKQLEKLDPIFTINGVDSILNNKYEQFSVAEPEKAKGILDNITD